MGSHPPQPPQAKHRKFPRQNSALHLATWLERISEESVTVYGELKHAHALIEGYSNIDGKPPRVAYTPISGTLPFPSSHSTLLSKMAAEYRSMVGIAMYMAQERFHLQFATKTLASCLKTRTQDAWVALDRLIGYLRYSEQFGLKMKKACKSSTFMELQMNVPNARNRNVIETFSDSDWSGSGPVT